MVGIQKRCYTHSPLPDAAHGARTVEVAAEYDVARCRPNFTRQLGEPIFF